MQPIMTAEVAEPSRQTTIASPTNAAEKKSGVADEPQMLTLGHCVACGDADKMVKVVDLGAQPLANGFHEPGVEPPRFPLLLKKCNRCHHCQLSHAVNPRTLFANYLYVSGTSTTARTYFAEFANKITTIRQQTATRSGCVLDIACNDGSQLDALRALGWHTYGVDPATNLVPVARAKGHNVMHDFWTPQAAAKMQPRVFDVVIAQNVLAHTGDPASFLRTVAMVCGPETDVYVQTSQMDMLFNGEFDTLYAEHISFFSVSSMQHLVNRCGFTLQSVDRVHLHGGSAVFRLRLQSASVREELQNERQKGLLNDQTVTAFAETVWNTTAVLKQIVADARNLGYGVVGFGAAAKAMTVLCTADISLDYIVDDNPLKQGLLSPGTNARVVGQAELTHDKRPLIIFVLAWNFLDEIVAKLRTVRKPEQNDRLVRKYIFPVHDDRSDSAVKDAADRATVSLF